MLTWCCAAALAAAAVQAPISQVTVYSDRARVVRTALVDLEGRETLELPLLDESVDASTIQLEAQGAQVLRVDIAHVDEQDFPRDEARELLSQIEALDDRIAQVNADRAARKAQLDRLSRLSPTLKLDDALKPNPKLSSAGWAAALQFVEAQNDKLQVAQRASTEKLFELHREREKLAVRAAQLGGARHRSGHRVQASVSGQGQARFTLTYMVGRARWYPSYDVQFAPEKGRAQISFSGRVSQESGEDWTDALLILSTAVPATSTLMPKLLSWKIGEKERFVPTPAPPPVAPVPEAPPVPPQPRSATVDEDATLQQRLAQIGQSAQVPASVDEAQAVPYGQLGRGALAGAAPKTEMKPQAPSVTRAPAKRKGRKNAGPVAPATPAEVPMGYAEAIAAAPPPAPASAPRSSSTVAQSAPGRPAQAQLPVSAVGLAPPPAYVPPSFADDLPASLAGGYDLSFSSIRRETIKAGEGARRVPLFSETWPVEAERVVYPALSPDAAFLVARIQNPSERVLPGGPADLAVGADPAGTAKLQLVAPGETFTLPLGLDRAIKPIRNVNVVTEEKGFIGKDEVTTYKVVIELANPYRQKIPIRVVDQVPLPANKEIELKLESAQPAPSKHDQATGELQWQLDLPAAGKSTVTYAYSLRRPKGYRLYQQQ
jgi:hypothetical protein